MIPVSDGEHVQWTDPAGEYHVGTVHRTTNGIGELVPVRNYDVQVGWIWQVREWFDRGIVFVPAASLLPYPVRQIEQP